MVSLLCHYKFDDRTLLESDQSAVTVEYTDCFSDTKHSDGDVPVIAKLWGMQSTSSLPSLPGPLWRGVVAPDKGPIYELNRTKPCFLDFTVFCI